jgi:hypothetical protein
MTIPYSIPAHISLNVRQQVVNLIQNCNTTQKAGACYVKLPHSVFVQNWILRNLLQDKLIICCLVTSFFQIMITPEMKEVDDDGSRHYGKATRLQPAPGNF